MVVRAIAKSVPAIATAGVAVLLAPRLSLRNSETQRLRRKQVPAKSPDDCKRGVRLLCQNVWNSFFAGGPDRVARLIALQEFVHQNNIDVLVTQEMFSFAFGPFVDAGEVRMFGERMGEVGLVYQTSPLASLPLLGQNSGLAIYSRFPIVEESHGTFNQRRAVSAKGWQEVAIELESEEERQVPKRLMLINTHLEHAHSQEWRDVRRDQCQQLAGRAAHLHERGDEFLAVLGDFNICEHAPWQKHGDGTSEYEVLRQVLRSSGCQEDLFGGGSQVPTMRSMPDAPPFAPDHFFASGRLRERIHQASVIDTRGRDGCAISDHFGLLIELRSQASS
eukprot:TRINITY_DN97901_c0_g1_i1.p1 TRINITY_DN97901_c0_g1~~TRINITY_DN97901_c0_g1_i1.p1  ORF type:complete len:334 (+),score=62.78 TRINITY_DN97901_c0_g1_i1:48-1049(+)